MIKGWGSSPRVAAHGNRRRETESPHVPAASCMQLRCLGPGATDLFSRILLKLFCTRGQWAGREAAFDALTAMGQSMIDAGGDYLFKMLQMILAG